MTTNITSLVSISMTLWDDGKRKEALLCMSKKANEGYVCVCVCVCVLNGRKQMKK